MSSAAAITAFGREIGLGVVIFASVSAVALPLAFISEGLALGAAIALGSVLIALLARRLRIALLIAALLAVLGAFGATHSISVKHGDAADPQRLAAMAPASGIARPAPAERRADRNLFQPATMMLPTRIAATGLDGEKISLTAPPSWALPALLFALWAAGYVALLAAIGLLRRLWRSLEAYV
ncbi:MAG: hypothetical protein KIT16_18370 [Rhodospirillaceae bacterium]|nr:hypothetical protein [Rhodospirillaceae bacterium]